MNMKSVGMQPAPALNISQSLKAFWRLPSLTVARFTLVSYIRSGWILGDIAIVWLLYAAFFLEFGGNVAYFFGTTGQGLGALAILGTIVMVQRAMSSRVPTFISSNLPFCLHTWPGDRHGSTAHPTVPDDDAPWNGLPYPCALVGHTRRNCD